MSNGDRIVFFVDRSLGRNYVTNALRDAGEIVEAHDDHFPQAAPDTVWLSDVAQKGWIILTADQRIAHRRLEKLAVEQSQAKVFILVSGNLSGLEMAEVFVKAVASMKKFASSSPAPFLAKVYKDGRVKAWK
jgi:predicted nuclease of predicted toxin-antitoxin system